MAKQNLPAIFLIFLVGILLSGCGGASPAGQPTAAAPDIPSLALAAEGEPGQPLRIYGQVVDASTNAPIPGARLYFYQANSDGEYLPSDPNDTATARLSGEITTGETGEFVLNTILPGEYDRPGSRHIHLHYVRAEGYEEINRTILFEDNASVEMRQWAEETGLGILLELDEGGGLMAGNLVIMLPPE